MDVLILNDVDVVTVDEAIAVPYFVTTDGKRSLQKRCLELVFLLLELLENCGSGAASPQGKTIFIRDRNWKTLENGHRPYNSLT